MIRRMNNPKTQVQDSLSKTKQDPSSSSSGGGKDKDKDKDKDGSNAPMSGDSSTHSSAEKPSSSRIATILSGSSNHGSSHNKASLFGPLLDMKSSNRDKDKDKDKDANGSAPGSPASLAAAAAVSATTAADVRALAIVGSNGGPSSKKKMLDLKLRQSGTSLAVRLKKQAPLTPSPSEFRARERQDLAGESVCWG